MDEVLEHIEKVGIGSAQYFCEEFVFIPDGEEPEQTARLHDPLYLDISEFNFIIGRKLMTTKTKLEPLKHRCQRQSTFSR